MGERFQAYIVHRINYNKPIDGSNTAISGIHDQWCYGISAGKKTAKVLESIAASYMPVDPRFPMFGESFTSVFDPSAKVADAMEDLLVSHFSINTDNTWKYISRLGKEKKVLANPLNGDNNQGIVVIDARDPGRGLAYAFCMLGDDDLTTARRQGLDRTVKAFEPLDVMTYMKRTYPDNPASYWRERRTTTQGNRKMGLEIGKTLAIMKGITRQMRVYRLLTRMEIMTIWPAVNKNASEDIHIEKSQPPIQV